MNLSADLTTIALLQALAGLNMNEPLEHRSILDMTDLGPIAWLRDLDGTGSLHACAEGDPGAIAVAPWSKVQELQRALEFYRDGFTFTTNPRRAGLEWKPTEALLDDCGNLARATLLSIPS